MNLKDQMQLNDRLTVVTGGAMGIGYAVALGLAQLGSDIAIIDIVDAKEVVDAIELEGRKAKAYLCDVVDPIAVENTFVQILKDFGHIDCLFNNAGVFQRAAAEEMSFEEWRRVLSIDLDSVFYVAQAAAKIMMSNEKGGSIVNTGSMSGVIVNIPQYQSAYNTAKAGVIHLTKSLAVEWAKFGIRVNCISPGYIHTLKVDPSKLSDIERGFWFGNTPMSRMGKPEELAGAVAYLLCSAASFTTGANLVVDGGYTCV